MEHVIVRGVELSLPRLWTYFFTTSTRRFCERPNAVSLLLTGRLDPNPWVVNRFAATPALTR